jgi:hypothetical protein
MLLGVGSGYKGPEIHPQFSTAVFLPNRFLMQDEGEKEMTQL